MKRSRPERTTENNLEERFDRGEEVLDYFSEENAKIVSPHPGVSKLKAKPAGKPAREVVAVVRGKSPTYGTDGGGRTKPAS